MGRVVRGTQGCRESRNHRASSQCLSGPSGCRSSRPNACPAPSWEEAPFKASRSRRSVCHQSSDTDLGLPSYEQLLRPQHKVSPRGGSRRSISRSIAPPAGSPLPPLSQQASSSTNRINLGLIRPPTLVISQRAPRYFFPSARLREITLCDLRCRFTGVGTDPVAAQQQPGRSQHRQCLVENQPFPALGCWCCHQQLALHQVF